MLNTGKLRMSWLLSSIVTVMIMTPAESAEVNLDLSSREAYVGAPLVLEVTIRNAADYELPQIPEIEGCDVEMAGAPLQSTSITSFNGRRSESRSVSVRYTIIPRRAGTFEVPPLQIMVDGQEQLTKPMRFVASKGQTSDLMFVEVEGWKDQIYVGEPLELTLKIWLRPFHDQETGVTLSEGDMWNRVSERSAWGIFDQKMQDMAANNRRPRGNEVLRADAEGIERAYYEYAIPATIYPTRPGNIDASDLQISVSYPTELTEARGPLDDFFGGSPFGGRSPLMDHFDDEFFRSPFSRRLTISKTRPLVGEVAVGQTRVVPIPDEGRPADYRGAVGQYQLAVQASPLEVAAGDPITLSIGIAGSGPMELVQAPPLHALPDLTANFKVADDALAGFVQEDTKMFSTTIRPLREGIKEIPPIPFSYFDPEKRRFETVLSDPIPIQVLPAQTLALDDIVSHSREPSPAQAAPADGSNPPGLQLGDLYRDARLLDAPQPQWARQWWLVGLAFPPLVWLSLFCARFVWFTGNPWSHFQSASRRCQLALERATDQRQMIDALLLYVGQCARETCENTHQAAGELRRRGLYDLANRLQEIFELGELRGSLAARRPELDQVRRQAIDLVHEIDTSWKPVDRRGTLAAGHRPSHASSAANRDARWSPTRKTLLMLLCFGAGWPQLTCNLWGQAAGEQGVTLPATSSPSLPLELEPQQRLTLFDEACELYSQATQQTDEARSRALYRQAADKFQLLVDTGSERSQLYVNLGNAYLQSDQLGRAVAAYSRARCLDPFDLVAWKNLLIAESKLTSGGAIEADGQMPLAFAAWLTAWQTAAIAVLEMTSPRLVMAVTVGSWWLLWLVLTGRLFGRCQPLWRYAGLPSVICVLAAVIGWLALPEHFNSQDGIFVTDEVSVRTGLGEQAPPVISLEQADGVRCRILQQRGDWVRITSAATGTGWVPSSAVEPLAGCVRRPRLPSVGGGSSRLLKNAGITW